MVAPVVEIAVSAARVNTNVSTANAPAATATAITLLLSRLVGQPIRTPGLEEKKATVLGLKKYRPTVKKTNTCFVIVAASEAVTKIME